MKVTKQSVTMGLAERALLAHLRVGIWSATKHDKSVTEEVQANHMAERDAGKFQKLLISKRSMQNLYNIATDARQHHYRLTLPWADPGYRILKATTYEEYSQELRIARKKFQAAVLEFVDQYPGFVTEAKKRLGTMFNTDDYPNADQLAQKFYFDVDIAPVPESGDFRVKLGDAEIRSLERYLEKRSHDRLKKAMSDVYSRLEVLLKRMVDRLNTYEPSPGPYQGRAKGTFKATLVTNLQEMADLIPALNITNDERMDQVRQTILSELCAHSPEELRISEALRERTAKQAEKLLKKVGTFIA